MSIINLRIGKFTLGIPSEKMYDIATLKTDISPAVRNLIKASKDEVVKAPKIPKEHKEPKVVRFQCRKGCKKTFISTKRRLTHEKKYHTKESTDAS